MVKAKARKIITAGLRWRGPNSNGEDKFGAYTFPSPQQGGARLSQSLEDDALAELEIGSALHRKRSGDKSSGVVIGGNGAILRGGDNASPSSYVAPSASSFKSFAPSFLQSNSNNPNISAGVVRKIDLDADLSEERYSVVSGGDGWGTTLSLASSTSPQQPSSVGLWKTSSPLTNQMFTVASPYRPQSQDDPDL